MTRRIRIIIATIGLFTALIACSDKISQPGDLPDPGSFSPDTTYVMVEPAWTEAEGIAYDDPSDVIIGYDRFVYVADRGNDRVVKLNLAGEFVESYYIPAPSQITQDRALDLLAVTDSNRVWRRSFMDDGEFEVVFTADDVYRPFPIDSMISARLFGIAASPFPDKDYFLTNFYEDSVFVFGPDDERDDVLAVKGYGVGLANAPIAVGAFDIGDLYCVGFTNSGTSFSIQLIDVNSGMPVVPFTDSADIYRPTVNGHKDIAMDRAANIFVSMASSSEVWKFNRNGVFQLKFGQAGGPADRLNNPRGVYIYQDYIYVADAGNNRVVRFLSSTAPQQ